MSKNYFILLGLLYFAIGQTIIWFMNNSQFAWEWWKDKPFVTVAIYSIPASLFFWYGSKYAYAGLGEVWGARLLGFGVSYLTFPALTYLILKESMFTTKTLICVALSFCIVAIQLFWK